MVEIALLLGIFSYIIFGLGLIGRLNYLNYLGILFGFILAFLLVKQKFWKKAKDFWQEAKKDKLCLIFLGLLIFQALINLIGALGPELSFDALWYHLTIPKIYLQWKKIFFIPGSLFYYSSMPKLTEMFYLLSLVFSPGGTLAKLIHFSFGILSAIALFNLSKRYLKTRESLVAVLIFYTSLIVGWQSIVAYVDLARTFFEILALDLFLQWWEADQGKKESKLLLIESAIMLGLAVSTKLIAFVSLPIYLILIFCKSKKPLNALSYTLYTILIPLPWLVFSFIHTGNPFYPVFSGILDQTHKIINFSLLRFFKDFWELFYHPQDFISPVFLIFLPIVALRVIKGNLDDKLRVLLGYVFLALFFWYFTPRTGGSRFILPYLPALSLLISAVVSAGGNFFQKSLLVIVIFSATINVGYRAIANKKYLPVIVGKESSNEFLSKNLNFKDGDFLDINGDLQKIIKKEDLVLICGFHNLFYTDFSFVEATYAWNNLPVSYILIKDGQCPENIALGSLIYRNNRTGAKLYLAPANSPFLPKGKVGEN